MSREFALRAAESLNSASRLPGVWPFSVGDFLYGSVLSRKGMSRCLLRVEIGSLSLSEVNSGHAETRGGMSGDCYVSVLRKNKKIQMPGIRRPEVTLHGCDRRLDWPLFRMSEAGGDDVPA